MPSAYRYRFTREDWFLVVVVVSMVLAMGLRP